MVSASDEMKSSSHTKEERNTVPERSVKHPKVYIFSLRALLSVSRVVTFAQQVIMTKITAARRRIKRRSK